MREKIVFKWANEKEKKQLATDIHESAHWAWELENELKGDFFIAKKDSKTVGYCRFIGKKLYRVFVNHEQRALGGLSSQLLIRAVNAYFKKNPNVNKLLLIAFPDKAHRKRALVKWYENHGFNNLDHGRMEITRAKKSQRIIPRQPGIKNLRLATKFNVPKPQRKRVR